MALGRSGVELDDLLIDCFRAIELLISERGLSLLRKFGEAGGLCCRGLVEGEGRAN
jgi:hypothetical protein